MSDSSSAHSHHSEPYSEDGETQRGRSKALVRYARAYAKRIRDKNTYAVDERFGSRTVDGVRNGTFVDARRPLADQRKAVWWCSQPCPEQYEKELIPFNATWAYVSVFFERTLSAQC